MLRNFAVFTVWRRTALTCGLCLLAIIFAVEAKTAWYGPLVGVGSDVRAAKAFPADMPRLIEHGIPVPDPIHPQIPFALLTAVASIYALSSSLPAHDETVRGHVPVALANYFFSSTFFRPPPVLS